MDATLAEDCEATQESTSPQAATPTPKGKGHVSVVFFHGMGTQRHYESISMLVEAVDQYVRLLDPTQRLGHWDTKLRRERLEGDDPDADCACIQVDYGSSRVRFYEAYCAPAAVGGSRSEEHTSELQSQR